MSRPVRQLLIGFGGLALWAAAPLLAAQTRRTPAEIAPPHGPHVPWYVSAGAIHRVLLKPTTKYWKYEHLSLEGLRFGIAVARVERLGHRCDRGIRSGRGWQQLQRAGCEEQVCSGFRDWVYERLSPHGEPGARAGHAYCDVSESWLCRPGCAAVYKSPAGRSCRTLNAGEPFLLLEQERGCASAGQGRQLLSGSSFRSRL